MVFFYKSLASFGIGSASVDTRLAGHQFQPGDPVKGEVHIRGGSAEQRIDDIYLYLVVDVSSGSKKSPLVLKEYRLAKSLVIKPGETRQVPFEIRLPMETPMSTGSYPVYLKTGLDIKMAKDPQDTDKIEVFPAPIVQKLLKQFEDTGFLLYRIHNEHDPGQKPFPFFQLFQFRPTGRLHGLVDQLNVIFSVSDDGIEMEVESIRSERIVGTSFAWKYRDPNGTFHINGKPEPEDPFIKIQQMLNLRKPDNDQ